MLLSPAKVVLLRAFSWRHGHIWVEQQLEASSGQRGPYLRGQALLETRIARSGSQAIVVALQRGRPIELLPHGGGYCHEVYASQLKSLCRFVRRNVNTCGCAPEPQPCTAVSRCGTCFVTDARGHNLAVWVLLLDIAVYLLYQADAGIHRARGAWEVADILPWTLPAQYVLIMPARRTSIT